MYVHLRDQVTIPLFISAMHVMYCRSGFWGGISVLKCPLYACPRVCVYTAIDQAVLLNELGRMFVHFGERGLAVSHYRKSIDVDISEQIPIRYAEQSFEAAVVTESLWVAKCYN